MSLYVEKSEDKHSFNAKRPKQASLLSLIILVLVVFCLQTGMREIVKGISPERNLLKLMVICQNLFTIFLPVCLALVILRLPARGALGLYRPPFGV